MINPTKYIIKNASPMRKFITQLDKSGAILPVVLLEATVTGGRTYQAYKRDGFVEARERVTEESLGAIFWLFGATMFGKLFDKIGRTFLKIPKNMPDVGIDNVRSPFKNFIQNVANKIGLSSEYLAKYSVGKTAASLITACLFIGYVVPKVNQAITRNIYGKMDKKDPNHEKAPNPYKSKLTIKDARSIFSAKDISINAVENFKAQKGKGLIANIRSKFSTTDTTANSNGQNPSFSGSADAMLRVVQNFEENAIWKLMGTDVGTVSGRTINARNKDERVEILFRDITSIYFYCFSMPHIVKFMNRQDSLGGLNTKLNPMSAREVHNHLINSMAKNAMEDKVPVDTFRKFALGDETNKDLAAKIFEPRPPQQPKKIFFGLIKKKPEEEIRTISLADFEKNVDLFAKPEQKSILKERARKMSELMQPERQGVRILTELQVEDILKGGAVREPEFMSEVLNNIFKKGFKSKATPLTNPYKYISQSAIDEKRKQILDYVEAIIKDAEKTGTVSAERMLKLNKRNMSKNGWFMGLAMGVSALFLSTIIPKVQYWITFLRTGKHTFPGTEDLKQQ